MTNICSIGALFLLFLIKRTFVRFPYVLPIKYNGYRRGSPYMAPTPPGFVLWGRAKLYFQNLFTLIPNPYSSNHLIHNQSKPYHTHQHDNHHPHKTIPIKPSSWKINYYTTKKSIKRYSSFSVIFNRRI